MNQPVISLATICNFNTSTILLVEDSTDHLSLMKTVLKECMPGINAVGIEGREAALEWLNSEWQKKGVGMPKLILLDLYLPTRAEGLSALKEFKAYFQSRNQPCIPVVMFSYSEQPEDINDCYRQGANAYIVKSPDYQAWKEYFEGVRDFWLQTVSLPMHEA